MEEIITVKMTKEALFDFMLYHTYSKFSGFLVNVLGMAVGIMGVVLVGLNKIGVPQLIFYFIAAAAFLAFTPLQLKHRAGKQMELNRELQMEWVYTFWDQGIIVVRGERTETFAWEKIQRMVTAPRTIGIYYGKDEAFIIPKAALGQRFSAVVQMIAKNIGSQNVRLR